MKKKSFAAARLVLSRDTVKRLENARLQEVIGGAPAQTRDVPCPVHTAKVDCG
jgi:hypothetical protein